MILGIDTSCDDTSAAVLSGDGRVLSNVVHSQVRLHHRYGGVVPELASREHVRNILPVVSEALRSAGVEPADLEAIAVTIGPGLIGSLLVGLHYARGLAYATGIPVVGVNHLEGHILSILLEEDTPPFPFVALTVSGGHTSLYHVQAPGCYRLLGRTLDDAAGEAFDKVAKLLGLGYPGGPVIERIARDGDPSKAAFPRAMMGADSLDFSFSGIKTAVALYVERWKNDPQETPGVRVEDIAASFQEAVIDVLSAKLFSAAELTGASAVVAAGGVACNKALRERLNEEGARKGLRVMWPRPEYCTDNGAMIAKAGRLRLLNGERAELDTDVRSRYPIDDLEPVSESSVCRAERRSA
jgi:N6-L-threonylcarbamoyladenine synthase